MVKNVGIRSFARGAAPATGEGQGAGSFKLPSVTPSAALPQLDQGSGGLDDIGPRLGELRRSLGMTQLDVAFRMGTTQPALARLEKGEAKANLRTLSRYAKALGKRAVVTLSSKLVTGQGGKAAPSAAVQSRTLDLEALPAALASMRKERGVTQSEVANRMTTTQPVIARLESGDGFPNLTTLERFSQAIGTDLDVSFEAPHAEA
jgi:transcriptional regulator with XRE-family HTH domain